MTNSPELYSRDAACEVLSISLSTLERQVRAGKLPAVKVGRKVLIRRADLEAYVAALESREGANV